jgi:hypothetical protein
MKDYWRRPDLVGIYFAISSNLMLPDQVARVNWPTNGLRGGRLPAIDFAHVLI